MKVFAGIRHVFRPALATVFPSQCVSCGEPVEGAGYDAICRDCEPRVQLVRSPRCLTCGFPFFGEAESKAHCMHCEHLQPEFGQGWSMALFRGPVRDLIHALKYEKGIWALPDLRRIAEAAPELEGFLAGATLVPVPLHPLKLRERGYNQSELIVRELVAAFPDCGVADLLRRVVDTPSQTKFGRQQRIRNLRNAFSLRRNRAIESGFRYVVVDDVFTTGSTLNACAAVLRKVGASRVDVLSVGHG